MCRSDYEIEDGERIFCGLDVGGSRAATALVWVTEDLRVGVKTWDGEEAVIFAGAALRKLANGHTIVEAAFDPWRFGAQAFDLSKRGIEGGAVPAARLAARAGLGAAECRDPNAPRAAPARTSRSSRA
jgi:hypothetical protein